MEKIETCPVCGQKGFSLFMHCRDHFLSQEEFDLVSCNACGFRFTNPRPKPEKLAGYYKTDEYISHSATRKGLINKMYLIIRSITSRKKRKIIERYTKGRKILDIGCGTGEFLNECRNHGWITTGVEPDKNAASFARNTYSLKVHDESFLNGNAETEYDVITLWHVLEHVSDLNKRMEQISRLLSPDGMLLVALPNCDSKDARIYGPFWAAYDVPRHLYHFTKNTMSMLLEKHQFKVQHLLPMKLDAYYVCMLSEKYMHKRINFLRAMINGFLSNVHARKSNVNYSSQIFVCKRG